MWLRFAKSATADPPTRPVFGAAFLFHEEPGVTTRELIIKDTHRGLYYEDGVLVRVLGEGGTSCR
jgi:hypothetical protein